MNKQQENNRNKLKETKPRVLDKILAHEHEMIPRIQLQWRTWKNDDGTKACPFNCTHCSVKNVGNNRELITLDDVRSLFQQADEIGISRMTISGGEPLTFDLDALVEAINSKLFWIQLDTNGWLLTKEKAQHLKNIGVDVIAPSLDSLDFNEHDKFRNKIGSAEKVIKAFDIIQELEIGTFVQTVVTRTRLYSEEFIKFIEYFNNRGIEVFVSFAKPVGSFAGHFEEMVTKDDILYFEGLEKEYNCFSHLTPGYNLNLERNCVAGKNIFAVTSTGDCLQCIYHYMSVGNIKEESFKDIYKRMQRINIYNHNTCPIADKTAGFVEKYVVPLYGKELPVSYKELLTEEDFDK